MEQPPYSPQEAEAVSNRIFEVLRPPARGKVLVLRPGCEIQPGDFAWASPRCPRDLEGMVHLTGYNEKMGTIWYADFDLSEVRYVGPKPTEFPNGKNPFPVKPAAPSFRLFYGRLKLAINSRRLWWKVRHIRRENRLKYENATNEQS